jgi:hypothetical protein
MDKEYAALPLITKSPELKKNQLWATRPGDSARRAVTTNERPTQASLEWGTHKQLIHAICFVP